MKKVALFLAEGFEEIEALATVDILRRAQIPVITVSVTGKNEVTGAHGIPVITDSLFNETNFSQVGYLVLPGGMPGARHLDEHEGLKQLITEFDRRGEQIAAICAAPMVLGGLGLLQDKQATCYPGFEEKLIGARVTGEKVVSDHNITTGRGPGLVFEFALTLVEQIAGNDKRREVAQGLLL